MFNQFPSDHFIPVDIALPFVLLEMKVLDIKLPDASEGIRTRVDGEIEFKHILKKLLLKSITYVGF